MVLHAIALEGLGAAIVHVDGQGDGDGPLREHEAVAIVRWYLQVIRDDLELVGGHLENVVVVDVHKARTEAAGFGQNSDAISARVRGAVKSNCAGAAPL